MTKTVTFVLGTLEDPFQVELVRAAQHACGSRGHRLTVLEVTGLDSPFDEQKRTIAELLSVKVPDGLILSMHTLRNASTSWEAIVAAIRHWREVPIVSLGAELPGASSVVVENAGPARLLVQHLVDEHQLRRIAFVTGPDWHSHAEARLDGYRSGLASRGIPSDKGLVFLGDFTPESGSRAAREMLQGDLPEAIICANDHMAIHVMDELRAAGIEVPRQVAVTGFDDLSAAHLAGPPLTTVRQPKAEQLEHVVELLERAWQGESPSAISITPPLVLRRSCGCGRRQHQVVRSVPPRKAYSDAASLFSEGRAFLVGQIHNASGHDTNLPEGWEEMLVDGLQRSLDLGPEVLIDVVDGWFERLSDVEGTLESLRDVLTHLTRILPVLCVGLPELHNKLAGSLDGAILFVGSAEALVEARHRAAAEERAISLARLGQIISSASDLATFAATATAQLQEVGVSTIAIGVKTEGDTSWEWPVWSVRGDDTPPPWAGRLLLPEVDCVVLPLFAQPDQLAVAILEGAAPDCFTYTLLRQALGSALKSSSLAEAVARANHELREQSIRDPLTELFNRRHMLSCLDRELERGQKEQHNVTVLLLDLDGFKRVNDRLGHAEGDAALRRVGRALRETARVTDSVGRFGGDEFIVILPGTGKESALLLAERMLIRLRGLEDHKLLSSSIGCSTLEPNGDTDREGLLRKAGVALEEAKRGGKNQALHHDDLPSG